MLDIQTIRDDPERARQAMRDRGNPNLDAIDRALKCDTERRETLTQLQEAQARSNIVSREIGIPCIVSCKNATTLIKDGDRVRLDGETGRVTIL